MKHSQNPLRVYLVQVGNGPKRLVRASHAATAKNHCIQGQVHVECASAIQVADLVAAGVRVETAGETLNPVPPAAPSPVPQPSPAADPADGHPSP